MKVRTVTVGLQLSGQDFAGHGLAQKLQRAKEVASAAAALLQKHSFEIQTLRLCTNSFEAWTDADSRIERIGRLVQCATENGFLFISVGQATTLAGLADVPKILELSPYVSASYRVAVDEFGVPDFESCKAAAEATRQVAAITDDGMRCFGFCASFGVQPHTPFFPAAYHEGDNMGFSIGLENGDLLFLALFGVTDFATAQRNLRAMLSQTYVPISHDMEQLAGQLGVEFFGIDASMVPSLEAAESVAKGFEFLPIEQFGRPGTLAACYTITSAIKSLAEAGVKLCGYSGVMLPVMEDVTLAERASQDPPTYRIADLLTYSSVCGVGLDTVPIPRSTSVEAIAGILMDVGSIAFRLHKPLSCRLFLTQQEAGEFTTFDSPYLCNCRVFRV